MTRSGRAGGVGTPPALRMATGLSGDPGCDLRWGAHRLALEAAAIEAIAAFDAAGLPSILLKGPVTAARLYPDTFRPYVDIDLLVPPGGYQRARAVLHGLGYDFTGETTVAGGFVRPRDGCQIDLHRTLSEVRVTPERLWQVLAAHRAPFTLHRATVTALDDVAFALHIALHYAQTGTTKPKPRQDLDRALQRIPMITWAAAWRLGSQLDALDAVTAALRCGPAAGDRLADALGAPPRARLVCRVSLRHPADGMRAVVSLSPGTAPATLRRWLAPSATQRAKRLSSPDAQQLLPAAPPVVRLAALRLCQVAAVIRAVSVEVLRPAGDRPARRRRRDPAP